MEATQVTQENLKGDRDTAPINSDWVIDGFWMSNV